MSVTLYVSVLFCQRCGQDHPDLQFVKLTNPYDEWGWFAMCPKTQQPLLVKVVGEGEDHEVTTQPTHDDQPCDG